MYSRLLECYLCHDRYSTISTTTGNYNNFLNTHELSLLFENSMYGMADISLFIIGHNAHTTIDKFIILLINGSNLRPYSLHGLDLRCAIYSHIIPISSLFDIIQLPP